MLIENTSKRLCYIKGVPSVIRVQRSSYITHPCLSRNSGKDAAARVLPTLLSLFLSNRTLFILHRTLSFTLPLFVRSTVDWPAIFIAQIEVILFVCGQAGKFSGGKGLFNPLAHYVFLSPLPSGLSFECVPGCSSSCLLGLDPSVAFSLSLFFGLLFI